MYTIAIQQNMHQVYISLDVNTQYHNKIRIINNDMGIK